MRVDLAAAPRLLAREWSAFALVFALLLIARVLGIVSVYFLEEDEASLATGVAALVADTSGRLYRYTVQFGYYRLIELIDLLFGGRIFLIPAIMKALSAAAGALIPALGLFAFRHELTIRERWLVVFALAVNPVIWRSSQYGNTAIVATAVATAGLVILSNRPTVRGRAIAVGLVALATLVRADTVLLGPVLLLALYRASASWRGAALWTAGWAMLLVAGYACVAWFDPRADGALQSVSSHMSISRPSLFWEYLLWAMSPFALAFASWGVLRMLEPRLAFLGVLAVWCLPTLLFYFRATTTPRYFLNAAVPLCIAAALGMAELADRLRTRMRPAAAWSVTLALASAHLFVALGHARADRPAELFYNGTFQTDDGPMPTGALLVRTYLPAGSLLRSLPRPSFGRQSYPFWEGAAFNKAVDILADPDAPPRTVVIVIAGGYGHALHYHTHAAGARYLSVPPPPSLYWEGPTWLQLGNARALTVAEWTDTYRSGQLLDVASGDEVWSLSADVAFAETAARRLPHGLALAPTASFDEHFRTFRVIGAGRHGV